MKNLTKNRLGNLLRRATGNKKLQKRGNMSLLQTRIHISASGVMKKPIIPLGEENIAQQDIHNPWSGKEKGGGEGYCAGEKKKKKRIGVTATFGE